MFCKIEGSGIIYLYAVTYKLTKLTHNFVHNLA